MKFLANISVLNLYAQRLGTIIAPVSCSWQKPNVQHGKLERRLRGCEQSYGPCLKRCREWKKTTEGRSTHRCGLVRYIPPSPSWLCSFFNLYILTLLMHKCIYTFILANVSMHIKQTTYIQTYIQTYLHTHRANLINKILVLSFSYPRHDVIHSFQYLCLNITSNKVSGFITSIFGQLLFEQDI